MDSRTKDSVIWAESGSFHLQLGQVDCCLYAKILSLPGHRFAAGSARLDPTSDLFWDDDTIVNRKMTGFPWLGGFSFRSGLNWASLYLPHWLVAAVYLTAMAAIGMGWRRRWMRLNQRKESPEIGS